VNAILSRLSREPQSYASLLKLWPQERLDGMLNAVRKKVYLYRGKFHVMEMGRDVLFCLTCKEEMPAEGAYRSCQACRAQATRNKQAQRARARRKRRDMQKLGRRTCNTCGREKWLYEFKKHKVSRSHQCTKCYRSALMLRKMERT